MNDHHKDIGALVLTGVGLFFGWIFTHLGLMSQFLSLASSLLSAIYWWKKNKKE